MGRPSRSPHLHVYVFFHVVLDDISWAPPMSQTLPGAFCASGCITLKLTRRELRPLPQFLSPFHREGNTWGWEMKDPWAVALLGGGRPRLGPSFVWLQTPCAENTYINPSVYLSIHPSGFCVCWKPQNHWSPPHTLSPSFTFLTNLLTLVPRSLNASECFLFGSISSIFSRIPNLSSCVKRCAIHSFIYRHTFVAYMCQEEDKNTTFCS